jgi:hypothetical protein
MLYQILVLAEAKFTLKIAIGEHRSVWPLESGVYAGVEPTL